MKLAGAKLSVLADLYCEGGGRYTGEKLATAQFLMKKGWASESGYPPGYFVIKPKGSHLLITKYPFRLIDVLAEKYNRRAYPGRSFYYARNDLRYVIHRQPLSNLPILLTHRISVVRELAVTRRVNLLLATMKDVTDKPYKEFMRLLLELPHSTIRDALELGWRPSLEDAIKEWKKELRSLDPERVIELYIETQLKAYGGGKTDRKRVKLLRMNFESLAEKFLLQGRR